MDLGQSKFDIGQRVWLVHTLTKVEYDPCEGCKGQFERFVEWPNGKKTVALCAVCRYHSKPGMSHRPRLTTKTEALWLTGTVWGISINTPSEWWMGNERKSCEVMYRLKDMEWLSGQKPEGGGGSYVFHEDVFHEEQMYGSQEEAQAYIDQHQVLVEEAA